MPNSPQTKNQNWRRLTVVLAVSFLLIWPAVAGADGFDPNALIADDRFVDTATLGGAAGIQKFLESQGSVLANTAPDFLTKLREPGDAGLKARLPDPEPAQGRLRTAAELIYDASTAAGLNPQVVLVTLQKEQSLVTGSFSSDADLQRALDRALGFGCPDEGGCSDVFLGFYYQLFGNFDAQGNRYIGMPASLVRSFYYQINGARVGRGPLVDAAGNTFGPQPRVRTAQRGDTIILDNTQGPPNNPPSTQSVTLSNFATAALYRYTPHVYNGNYNFYKFFVAWFRYPNGTLVQTVGGAGKLYVIDNGLVRPISSFVITQRGLNPASVVTLSPLEFGGFSAGDVVPPADGTLLKDPTGQVYLMESQSRKSLSSFVATQRKLNLAAAVLVPAEEIATYKDGGRALPADGTLVKSSDNAAVYLISGGQKRLLSAFVFRQRGLKFADVLSAAPGELDGYPSGSVMPPLDGTLVKAAGTAGVYYVGNGELQGLTAFVFKARNFQSKDIVTVAAPELGAWPQGRPMPPPTGLLIKSATNPTVYYTESGLRRPVSLSVFLARRFAFRDVLGAGDAEINSIELGDPLQLPELATVKTAAAPTVYYLINGVLRPLSFTAFKNRGLLFSDVVTMPPDEFAKYPVGDLIAN